MIRSAISPRFATSTRFNAGTPAQPSGSMEISGSPYSTVSPFSTMIAVTTPATGAGTWLISFMTSTIATVSPAATRPPTSTNGGAPGAGARQNRPTEGDWITSPAPVGADGAAGVGAGSTASAASTGAGCGASTS